MPDSDAALLPAPGGTGAFGIVAVGGKQKMYLPLRDTNSSGNGVVAVVDVSAAGHGVSGAPALMTDIDLGTLGQYATATGGDSSTVIAVSTEYPTIWFIDPTTDQVTKTIQLDSSYGQSDFSGGGGYVTGVAMDSANHRAILSTWNGFTFVDLATKQITNVIQAPPSENFGFDSVHQRIIAPFYDCMSSQSYTGTQMTLPFCNDYKDLNGTVMSEGLNVIDLADGTIYTYQDPNAENPTSPVGSEPDSAAADPKAGVVVVPSEGGGYQNIIDLSQATFDKTKKIVTAPHRYVTEGLEGVAIEGSTHIAFFEGEGSSDVGVVDLPQANGGPLDGGMTEMLRGTMPDLPPDDAGYASSWSNIGDPHGIAVTTGLADGRPVGFLVNDERTWVARVDLATMLSLRADASFGQVTSDQMASAVTYLDARTKP